MLSSITQWLAENESVFSALAAMAALLGVTFGVASLALSPWRARRNAAREGAVAALTPQTPGQSSEPAPGLNAELPARPKHQADLDDDHVSVAVLSFDVLSRNEDDKYIAAGIASEIIALITPVSDLRVSARSTIYGWEANEVSARQAVEEINAKFALTGSLRIEGKRMRVIANLTEPRSDSHVWTGTYDKQIEDLFEVQYQIARSIVGAILGEVRLAECELADKLPEQQLDAWGLLQKAYYFWLANFTVKNVYTAINYLRKAIDLDPDYAAPKAALAMLLSQLTTSRVCEDHDAALAEIAAVADDAYHLAPNDANVLESLGVAWQNIGEGRRALNAFRRALELAPLNLICRGYLAMTLSFIGGQQGAAEARLILTENFSIAPRHPSGPWWHWFLAVAEQALGQYETSRIHCEQSLMGQQNWVHSYYFLANALCELGHIEEAQTQLSLAKKVNPAYSIDEYVSNLRLISGSDELAKPFYSGFVKAGLGSAYGFTGQKPN
jgi:adenylate cyclase